MAILAIDPGNVYSGYCLIDQQTLKPLEFGKQENLFVLQDCVAVGLYDHLVIERIASYGMPVGREVFETCEWIGRFTQAAIEQGMEVSYVYRKEEKICICGSPKAKDANIRQALIDRFAQHDLKNGKGTKNNPDWFYGFKADIWAAYCVGITYLEREAEKKEEAE